VNSTGLYIDDDGQLLCDITLSRPGGRPLAKCTVRAGGHTHTGVSSFAPRNEGVELVLDEGAWDCREWQWWENHGYGKEMRPRQVPASGGFKQDDSGVYVMSQYTCDGTRTRLEWTFAPQADDDILTYDCLITIDNVTDRALVEYGQFFACYTETNRDRSQFFRAAAGAGRPPYSWRLASHRDDRSGPYRRVWPRAWAALPWTISPGPSGDRPGRSPPGDNQNSSKNVTSAPKLSIAATSSPRRRTRMSRVRWFSTISSVASS
jgi:hypothetical protein